jgi:hypothetical protein
MGLMCAAMAKIYSRYKEQKKLYESLEKTVDRILQIEAEGGIDGWERGMREKKAAGRKDGGKK